MSCVPLSERGVTNHWQDDFLAVLPALLRHAKFRFRYLHAERREEAIQEAIVRACVSYERLVSQGNLEALRASTLAEFAVRRVRGGRRVGARKNSRDVLGSLAPQKFGFEVQSLTPWCDNEEGCRLAVAPHEELNQRPLGPESHHLSSRKLTKRYGFPAIFPPRLCSVNHRQIMLVSDVKRLISGIET
jgi:DNA-directed RNA polymerase specialized sigma24 family protein